MIQRVLLVAVFLSMACVSLNRGKPPGAVTPTDSLTAPPGIPSATPTPSPSPTLCEDARMGEEYRLYDEILARFYIRARIQCIVMDDHTTVSYLHTEDERTRDYLQESFPDAGEDLLADFFLQNEVSVTLLQKFDVDIPVILISRKEISDFFREGGGGWDGFYRAYPGAQGILQLSRAGFNAAMDQALVYAGNQADYLAGAGYVLLMEKENGAWIIQNSEMVWIS
jgi:hypothetical protein